MSEKARIPEVRPGEFGPQIVQAVAESYLGTVFYESDPTDFSPWVERYDRLSRLERLGNTPQHLLRACEADLRPGALVKTAGPYLQDTQSAQAFNQLLTDYAKNKGILPEVTVTTKAKPVALTPEEFVDQAIDRKFIPEGRDFAQRFLTLNIPHAIRLQMIELHTKALYEAGNYLARHETDLTEGFEASLEKAVNRGLLPAVALPDATRQKRLEGLVAVVSDPVVNKQKDRGGHYDANSNAICIDAQYVYHPQLLKAIFFHEMMHAYSGHSLQVRHVLGWLTIMDPESFDKGEEQVWTDAYELLKNDAESPEVGLSKMRTGLGVRELNEAYTEYATLVLQDQGYSQVELWRDFITNFGRGYQPRRIKYVLHEQYGSTYLSLRIMLAGLVAAGIPEQLFGEAYFESYIPKTLDPDRPAGQRMLARRALDTAIQQRTGFKSLRQLVMHLRQQASQGVEPKTIDKTELEWRELSALATILEPKVVRQM